MPLSQEEQDFFRRAKAPYAILESGLSQGEEKMSYIFSDPVQILSHQSGESGEDFFSSLELALSQGYWLCGYFSYEFGHALEPALSHLQKPSERPLAWLGVFKKPQIFEGKLFDTPKHFEKNLIKNISPSISKEEYIQNIANIHEWIENGKGYQLNYTFRLHFELQTDPLSLYCTLSHNQPTHYQSFFYTGKEHILSFSPELFFRKKGNTIIVKPMKGTIQRGKNLLEDEQYKAELLASEKIRAENVMIVDLLRNDLGKIGKNVRVEKLFEVEKYPTLFQMTSTVSAEGEENAPWEKIFRALFPCGSITGAPKIEAMKKIAEVENTPRGVYTGAIGFLSPNRDACFSVAIRTLHLEDKKGILGIGGGIVYDSDADAEHEEAMTKSFFLSKNPEDFSLKEKILWEKERGFFLLEEHLERIAKSAHFFNFPFSAEELQQELLNLEKTFSKERVVVSILLLSDGKFSFHIEEEKPMPKVLKILFSPHKVEKQNFLLQHKTTLRKLYDAERIKALTKGFFEVIFTNTDGEITEGSITNVFVQKNGMLFTPPVACGLLPGTLRASLLKSGKCREKVLHREDLFCAEKIFVGNSIRGLLEVVFEPVHSDFAEKVFAVVKKIPKGTVLSYSEVAKRAGNPKACRAVGSILARNINPKKIPCHRVIQSNGFCGEYAFGGREAKIKKLKEEGVIIEKKGKIIIHHSSIREGIHY